METILDKPPIGQVLFHAVVPQLSGPESILLAVGILGATVMPHAIYLHSSLMQNRIVAREPSKLRRLLRFEIADVSIAMGIAGLINMAMLIMAAATFFRHGMTTVGTLEEAHKTLEPLLGKAASWVFGVSLLASGLSSSSVGTMAGQVIMQGFIQKRIPSWIRRLATMVPSLAVIIIGLDPTRTLVISQVLLSFGLSVRHHSLGDVHHQEGHNGNPGQQATHKRPGMDGRGADRLGSTSIFSTRHSSGG